jgi:hypothetical protein
MLDKLRELRDHSHSGGELGLKMITFPPEVH